MLRCQEWPLLCPLLLYARFLEVPVNRLLGGVRRAGKEKLLGSYLRIYNNRASYKSVISNCKDGGGTIAFRGDARNLVRRVIVYGSAS